MSQHAYDHVYHTQPYNLSALSCYSSTAAFNNCYSELTPHTALANSYGVRPMTHTNKSKAMAINDSDYSCHITAVKLVYPIVWGPYHATSLC